MSRVFSRRTNTRPGGCFASWDGRTDLEQASRSGFGPTSRQSSAGLGQKFAELRGQADEARRTIARHEDQIKKP